ncbi:MAG: alpha/beta fold hydrolase [Limnochordaceae bacterium]|nr:alpha/beta fold hydrolase [Limnochordaceae bacterium]
MLHRQPGSDPVASSLLPHGRLESNREAGVSPSRHPGSNPEAGVWPQYSLKSLDLGPIHWSYLDSGTSSHSAPLVLLHAYPLHSAMWTKQLELLGKATRVIAPDLPGFGKSRSSQTAGTSDTNLTVPGGDFMADKSQTAGTSDANKNGCSLPGTDQVENPASDGVELASSDALPSIDALASIDAYADAIVRFLDGLGVRRAIFAGLSMGGYIALALWRLHREHVAGLVLADTRASADSPSARDNRFRLIERLHAEGAAAAVDQFVPGLIGPTTRSARPELIGQLRTWILQNSVDGLVAAARAMAQRADSTLLLPTINVPSVVIVGEEDQFSPPAEAAAMAANIPTARLVRIPQAGHLTALEQPEAFAQAVTPLLAASTP